jgi:hypothetical protein
MQVKFGKFNADIPVFVEQTGVVHLPGDWSGKNGQWKG